MFIFSPRSKKEVHHWFNTVPRLGLGAEDGAFYRFDSFMKNEYDWSNLREWTAEETDWKDRVERIMQGYIDKLDGSYIDLKENTIVFDW